MDSFFIYRLPGENDFKGGIGSVTTGIETGFLISSFYNLKDATLTIRKEENLTIDTLRNFKDSGNFSSLSGEKFSSLFPFPDISTSKDDYISDVSEIIGCLNENEKTVYCRAICGRESINIADSLISLDQSFPEAMVFCFHTPHSGTWIGATPEKLLANADGKLTTMALAGTRRSTGSGEWDSKNIAEQNMVTEYIADIFTRNGFSYSHDTNPGTKKVGNLEHLCTNFQALAPDFHNTGLLREFLYDLSPTPALCGLPKEKSLGIISQHERFSRAYYGGFLGPVFSAEEFALYVILRSVWISGGKWCMYAGGGITQYSVPETEWIETENKAGSILGKLQFFK